MKISNVTIHPKDRSTEFLKPIYANLANNKLITDNESDRAICKALKSANRVLMLGHGLPIGLLSVDQFTTNNGLVIGANHVSLLKDKPGNVYIWCHANVFVEKHDLKGFYTGMFISELQEAVYCGVPFATHAMIDESNTLFSMAVGKYLHLSAHDLLNEVLLIYGAAKKDNPIVTYNISRLNAR
jgi:hypothetical protein